MQKNNLATAQIDAQTAVAGSFVSIRYSLTVLHPIDDTGYIKITFRTVTDIGHPQFDDPDSDNYCSISTTGNCRIDPRWDIKGHKRPWSVALYLKVMGGYLDQGDTVTIDFGDTSKSSRGWQMQTFCEDTFEFKTFIDHIATFQFIEIEKSPALEIIPGEPIHATCIVPSQVSLNQAFDYYLKLDDYWGNPSMKNKKLHHKGFDTPGIYRISARDDETGLEALSNPIQVVEDQNALSYFWADFHGQSEETVGTNTIDQYFAFARDHAMIDICGHQGNDFQVTDAFWDKIREASDFFYKEGEFVTFPGYEWSGNTPLGGDRNVYFEDKRGKISRSSEALIPDKTDYLSSPTANKLFEDLRSQEVGSFVFAHVGGRYADIEMHDDELEVAMEIHSAWGSFEWLLHDAFDRGYRVGVCANSDGHKARPGASYPGRSTFGSLGGLTCVRSRILDRKHIAQAMRAHSCYATTGNRMLVDLELEFPDGRICEMGETVESDHKTAELKVQVSGTSTIESIDLFNGRENLQTICTYGKNDLANRVKILWSGAERRGRARKVSWDGSLHIENNTLSHFEAINFWNPDGLPVKHSDQHLSWSSITTGGGSGLILSLEHLDGVLELQTAQGQVQCSITSIGMQPQVWEFGGIAKKIEIQRLPDKREDYDFSCSFLLDKFERGDNPIYVRVNQEDGHRAWTSPIYIVR